ncbi:MAG: acylphosphatase [Betaproteobacteria bacterium]
MTITRNLRISGHVQGVGFRMYVARKARELGLAGWVRNRRDGSVEAEIQGTPAAVDAMAAAARRGPSGSVVTGVKMSGGNGQYQEFEVRPTE